MTIVKHCLSRERKSLKIRLLILKGEKIGDGKPHFVFGPCAVESYEQVATVQNQCKQKD